jgi:carbamoyltransferase
MVMNRRHPIRYLGEWSRLLIHNRFTQAVSPRQPPAASPRQPPAVSPRKPVAGALRGRINRMRAPKLGRLYQYPPRPLVLPRQFAANQLKSFPKISIVTPSFNHGMFIERTLKSVLDQGYPSLEYVVQDGGSTDETRSILERYSSQLHYWECAADAGQSQAINRGFAHTSGEIMAWLNSDDVLLPGSLQFVGGYFVKNPDVDVIYGHRLLIDANDAEVGRWVMPPHQNNVLVWADYIPQESLFWRRRAWVRAGGTVDESFHFAVDWDLLLRFRKSGARFVRVPQFLAAFRVHPQQKTSAQISELGVKEMDRLRTREHGRPVSKDEIERHTAPYLLRHLLHHGLYRLRSRFGSPD